MAVGWHTIAGDGDPISGNPGDFLVVERCFGQIKDRMSELDREYAGIRFGTSDDFRGEAANAFASKIGQISQALGEVPLIAAQLEGTFRSHRTQLEALRSEASSALARAQTNWGAVGSARENCDDATGRLRFVDDQLEYLDSLGEAGDPGDRNYWVSERIEASDWVVSAKSRLSNAEDDLQDSRAEHRQLSGQEDDLDQATAEALRNTVLWSLADPSFLEQLGDAFVDFVDWLADVHGYVFSLEFLEDLYAALDIILIALAVIALFAATGGTFALVVFALAFTKASIGFVLWQNDRISGWDFALDVLGAFAAGTTVLGSHVSKIGKLPLTGRVLSGEELTNIEWGIKWIEAVGDFETIVKFVSGDTFDSLTEAAEEIGDHPIGHQLFTELGPSIVSPLTPIGLNGFRWSSTGVTTPQISLVLCPTDWN